MEFRILGPLEVLDNGRPIDVGGAKQRALLAILLLNANEVVSADRLIDALWEDEAPENARKTLQVHVSQLRKVLGKERLETRAPGYALRVQPSELDLDRFGSLMASGEHGLALELWRGTPLSEFAYQRFAQTEIGRLEELRLACIEDRIDADLAAGRHATLVGELEALVTEHPLRERFRAQLLLALYRSGRQAEALEAYQDARRTLVDGLGIEPSRRLRDLQQAILEQSPVPDLEPTVLSEAIAVADPPSVTAAATRGPEPASAAQRKTVTVVHVLMTIESADGEALDPEVLRRVTTRALEEVTEAVHAHGGSLESVAGDAVSAVFGLPVLHEDDPLRAVRAATDIEHRLGPSQDELVIRIGVSTGAVVTAGDGTGPQLRATGEPFGRAAELARDGPPWEVCLDDATRNATRAARRGAEPFGSPMIGRGRERRRLHDAFAQAAGDRSCQLFTVLGAAGVGKSRLVHEFIGDLNGAIVARGRCLPYGEGITYWPLVEAVRDLASLNPAESPEDGTRKLEQLVRDAEDSELVVQRVSEVIGLAETEVAGEESFWAVRTFLETIAGRGPLVLVFDDIHWGEPTFLDLVDHISDWSRDAPILLLCIARPELLDVRPSWGGGKLNSTSVLLEPLSDEDSVQLVDNLAGSASLDEAARTRIVETADGNPLFVEEMLAFILENASGQDLEIPPTIHALLAARLDRLPGDERAAIEAASVEGKVFHEAAVGDLVSAPAAGARDQLLALARRELIRPDRPLFSGMRAYRFRHLLIRDAAYESIPKESRAALHELYAAWLERHTADRELEFEEILGYHLEHAFRYHAELGSLDEATAELAVRAGGRLGDAGRRALVRGDTPAAMNLASRAAVLLSPEDPARVHLVPSVRAVQGLGDQLTWAEDVLAEALAVDDARLAAHARVQRALLRLFTRKGVEVEELVDVATEAIRTFEELDDELGQARAWRLLQQAHYLGRQSAESADAAENALFHARRADDALEEVEVMAWLGVSLYMGATPAPEAIRRAERHLTQVRASRTIEALMLSCLAPLKAMQGHVSEARELVRRARTVVDDLGYVSQLAVVPFYAGVTELLANDPPRAEQEFRAALEPLEAIGETSTYCSIVAGLAQATYLQGRYDDAEELTRVSERFARFNDVHAQITWRSVRMKALARRGEIDESERLAQQAIAFAAESDFLNANGDALVDLAEVLRLTGRAEAAVPALEQAIELFERKGNAVSVAGTREVLQELRSETSTHGSGRA